ncbi:hypothetical protein MIND_00413900 [Mycena indigotica]|uniref:Uncharacterized protein n=1 Tax=Mycena indigotica TaxID=2126181 RepID=A0A8H6SVV2_9AGAR|nr:uncharacterized protein MIND_00413900 [Mycena indigotica]KAF7306233.1 hypothetical protein MIND_00413900 [Mycena indigotica]
MRPLNPQQLQTKHTNTPPPPRKITMSFTSPTKRRVTPRPYKPADWRVQRSTNHLMQSPISFDYRHTSASLAGQGVAMRDLRLQGNATRIEGANDLVLAHSGLARITFRIIWPGYEHVEWCRTMSIVSDHGAPITRLGLAIQVASSFAHWTEKTQYEKPTSPEWMVSPACVQFKHMYLVSLHVRKRLAG